MKCIDFNLFPTLVSKYEHFLSEQQVSDIFQFCLKQPTEKHTAYIGNAVSSHTTDTNTDILNDIITNVPSCRDLKKHLTNTIKEFEQKYGLSETILANSWFNIQDVGSSMLDHVHSGSIISGCIYINVDTESSKTYFHNPNNIVSYYRSTEYFTQYNFEYYYFQPEKGSLLLFPSWLEHGSHTDVNRTDKRMVISFNTVYK